VQGESVKVGEMGEELPLGSRELVVDQDAAAVLPCPSPDRVEGRAHGW
jgi:hypothetical protein